MAHQRKDDHVPVVVSCAACARRAHPSLAIVGISVAYASLMAYIQRSDRRLALAIVEELGADHDHDSSVEPQVVPKIAV